MLQEICVDVVSLQEFWSEMRNGSPLNTDCAADATDLCTDFLPISRNVECEEQQK